MEVEYWGVFDRRTGSRVSALTCLTRDSAARYVAEWRARGRQGGRPDIAPEALAALEVRPLVTRGPGVP